ncbi:ABC transporter ATP-binding protein/permease [Candidatus Gracilibacteria bacterium]|nr:ABC transporter ATP-binding protein/permease [Candidatus Gracilibacteria bacterium]
MKDDPIAFIQNITEAVFVGLYMVFSIEITKLILKTIQSGDTDFFYTLIALYAVVSIILMGARFMINHWGWARISMGGVSRLSHRYLSQFVQADGNQVEKIGTGRFISILEKGMYKWMDVLFDTTFTGTVNLIMVIYAMYTIASISFIGGIISFGLLLLAGIVATYANIWMAEKRQLRRKEQNEANHHTVVMLMSKNELLQNNGLDAILQKISHHLDRARKFQETVNLGFVVIEEFPRFIFLILRIGVYIYIVESAIVSNINIVDLGMFVTIIVLAEKNMNEFLHMLRAILREFSQISILWETFDSLSPIRGYDVGKKFIIRDKNIEIQNISYGYSSKKIFEDFSLIIEKGKKIALVGASGGGKTTLIKLIAGYLRPESGSISILGNELGNTALKTYYPHIGYLTQDPAVFDATIRDNLLSAIGDKNSKNSDKKLIEALKLAHCEFVFDLEKGLDTEIGERGVRLSGGQKQRIAIAKIFLKDPEIILLDEPTSALDSFSEEAITIALDELFKGRTVIIVAHRLQTVRKADDIIVLEGGKVIERGVHDELVNQGGTYAKMLELQSGF